MKAVSSQLSKIRLRSQSEDYAGLALLGLAIFYGIYFGEMLAQKRKGIQTSVLELLDAHTKEMKEKYGNQKP